MRKLLKKYFALLCLAAVAMAVSGCSHVSDQISDFSGGGMGVTRYNPSSLQSLKNGRQFISQGRLELAKEQYLMALAASNDPQLRMVINQELAAVDLMIRTQR